jgi:hypothetical protein
MQEYIKQIKNTEAEIVEVVLHYTDEAGIWQWVIYPFNQDGVWLCAAKTYNKAVKICEKFGWTILEVRNDKLFEEHK